MFWLWFTNAVLIAMLGVMGWAIFTADRKKHPNRYKD